LIVRHEDCAVTREVTSRALCRIEGFGFDSGAWRADGVRDDGKGVFFRILREGRQFGEVQLALSGDFNVRNALAVTAAAAEQGVPAQEITSALASFRGVQRRLEERGEADGVLVLDDFAHHPTAIAETLRAVRRRYAGRKIWAVLEPRSWSLRRNVFQERLPACFESADEVILAGVYGAAEVPAENRLDPERIIRELTLRGKPARYTPEVPAIVQYLVVTARPGDVVVALSNGAFGGFHDALLSALSARNEER
jgi:UDP-N-acetylmuramate: L-alanyl-gamma-D-glutamyl-meso-diaminopimelate ligase